MRDTARTAVIFLILGTVLTLIPLSLTGFLLPLRLIGTVLLLIGFRLVLGSRTDDIRRYKFTAWLSPFLYVVYLLLFPLAIFLLVWSFVKADSIIWRILFYLLLGIMGALFTLAFTLFQLPLRRRFGKVVLLAVAVLSLICMAVLPPLSGPPSAYIGEKAGDGLDRLRIDIDDRLQTMNTSFEFDLTNTTNMENLSAKDFGQYLLAMFLNPFINQTKNVTSEILWAVKNATVVTISFLAPVILFDIGHSIAAFLWLIVLVGTIVTMGRIEQREKMEREIEKMKKKERGGSDVSMDKDVIEIELKETSPENGQDTETTSQGHPSDDYKKEKSDEESVQIPRPPDDFDHSSN